MATQSFKLESSRILTSRLVNPRKRQLWKEIVAYPQYATNFLRLGRWLTADGQFEEAVFLYEFAVRKHRDSYGLLLKLGLAYENSGQEATAIRTYRRVIRRWPGRFQAYLRLEKLYRRSSNFEKAINLYRDISIHNPIKVRGFERLFHIYAIQGDFDRAIRTLQGAIKNYGESHRRCLELGKLYFRCGDFLGAVQSFESAVACWPQDVGTRIWLGIALKELGNHRLAEYEFNEVLKIKPDSFQSLIHLAELKIQRKQFDEALNYLQQIDDRSPNNARVDICRGWIALEQGRAEEAIACCARGLKESRFYFVWEQVLAHRILTKATHDLGQPLESKFHQLMATYIARKDTYESLIGLAEKLLKRKELELATKVYLRVLELYPRNTRAQIGLGEIFLKQEKPEEAILLCRQALGNIRQVFIRERIRAHTVIGLAYRKQKKRDLYRREHKTVHALLRQLYLKPKEKLQLKKGITLEK